MCVKSIGCFVTSRTETRPARGTLCKIQNFRNCRQHLRPSDSLLGACETAECNFPLSGACFLVTPTLSEPSSGELSACNIQEVCFWHAGPKFSMSSCMRGKCVFSMLGQARKNLHPDLPHDSQHVSCISILCRLFTNLRKRYLVLRANSQSHLTCVSTACLSHATARHRYLVSQAKSQCSLTEKACFASL